MTAGPPRRIIVAGHSHALALGVSFAPKAERARTVPIPGRGPQVFGLRGSPRTDAYWRRLVSDAKNSTVLVLWAGNQHLVHFLLAQGARFDFHLARHPTIRPAASPALMPEAVVRHVLSEQNKPLAALLARLKARRGCVPVLVGTPPPKGDDDRLRPLFQREMEAFDGHDPSLPASDIALTPPSIRRKLWLVVQDLQQEAAATAGCAFVPVPVAAMDADGFLKHDLWAEDISHANRLYGDLMWTQIEHRLHERVEGR